MAGGVAGSSPSSSATQAPQQHQQQAPEVQKNIEDMSPEEFMAAVNKINRDSAPTADGSLNQASKDQNVIHQDEYLKSHAGQEIQDVIKVAGQNKVVVVYPNGDRVDYEGTDIQKLADSPEYKIFTHRNDK